MDTYGVAEDPTALRDVATTFRREAHAIDEQFQIVTQRVLNSSFEGPRADALRSVMQQALSQVMSGTQHWVSTAGILELHAATAELEIATRRLAGQKPW